jgi:hypothetical protein
VGINTGEEELYWRIKEKVKKKRRRPKPAARESRDPFYETPFRPKSLRTTFFLLSINDKI